MTDEQISQLTNQFVKMMTYFGGYSPEQVRGLKIVLDRGDGFWDLKAVQPEDAQIHKHALVFDMPELPEDKTDAMIELAGAVSTRLHKYAIGMRRNAGRSESTRKASAKKASDARWH